MQKTRTAPPRSWWRQGGAMTRLLRFSRSRERKSRHSRKYITTHLKCLRNVPYWNYKENRGKKSSNDKKIEEIRHINSSNRLAWREEGSNNRNGGKQKPYGLISFVHVTTFLACLGFVAFGHGGFRPLIQNVRDIVVYPSIESHPISWVNGNSPYSPQMKATW